MQRHQPHRTLPDQFMDPLICALVGAGTAVRSLRDFQLYHGPRLSCVWIKTDRRF